MPGPLKASLHAAPSAARLAEADPQTLSDRRAAAREAAAYAAGDAAGRAALVESGAAALEALLAQLEQRAAQAEEQIAQQAVELAVEVARAIVRTRVEAGEHDLERVVRAALADADVGRGEVVVHLNPLDHAQMEGVELRAGTTLESDPTLARGDVHLSTPRGLLVRDVQAALESIREQLMEDLVR